MTEYFPDGPFEYNRTCPPLFFCALEKNEAQHMADASREYYRVGVKRGVTHLTVLSSGISCGEMAMHICYHRNKKRRQKV